MEILKGRSGIVVGGQRINCENVNIFRLEVDMLVFISICPWNLGVLPNIAHMTYYLPVR